MNKYEAKKFNIRDKVFIVRPHLIEKDYVKGHVYKIVRYGTNAEGNKCYKFADSPYVWYDDELELVEPFHFEEGDIVKLNPDARLEDFARGKVTDFDEITVYSGTEEKLFVFDSKMRFDVEYVIGDLSYTERNAIKLKGFGDYWFESALFTLVRRPEKIKEVTMAEIEEKFGCKIKIVRETKE